MGRKLWAGPEPYADDNCYHGPADRIDAHCKYPIQERAWANSWEEGSDITCASLGMSGTYKCGYILEENHWGGNKVRVGMTVISGDSGSGMKWNYRIDGILTDRGESEAFFQTAFHVQQALGDGYFYFNCAVGETVHTNAWEWGACPGVDA